jgi:hypothetical protein
MAAYGVCICVLLEGINKDNGRKKEGLVIIPPWVVQWVGAKSIGQHHPIGEREREREKEGQRRILQRSTF